jgi:peptidyl-prolyl cis-trans isomerase SurA
MSQKVTTAVAMRAIAGATFALGSIFIAGATTRVASADAIEIVTDAGGVSIEEHEIEWRLRFNRLASQREWSRDEVISELRAEKGKLRVAQLSGVAVTDSDVNAAYADMARRMNLTAEQLTAILAHAGVDVSTLRNRIRADIAWRLYRRTSASSVQPFIEPAPPEKPELAPSWRE